ncbi:hypothetical protein HMPREF0511_0233 [Limosilactobacillus fermentum ATCC 14931]|nr:hypothetical protein HMPREF0511_0233 [Limosilactobacillus fermentum ATCC 14931]
MVLSRSKKKVPLHEAPVSRGHGQSTFTTLTKFSILTYLL